ncbi:hypothetical protein GA0074695_4251 [Micromonospora viridifaciens]|uniref:Uncharacterized protein n=1 Tax=Micromonospora viridifaciens TaxID=1881 RepID=A0A1C4YGC0_MICVI|nr:hypothetical protein GA0074695_4251 [Micromonospora viridifaciens]
MSTDTDDLVVACSDEDDNPEDHIGEPVEYDLTTVEQEGD